MGPDHVRGLVRLESMHRGILCVCFSRKQIDLQLMKEKDQIHHQDGQGTTVLQKIALCNRGAAPPQWHAFLPVLSH